VTMDLQSLEIGGLAASGSSKAVGLRATVLKRLRRDPVAMVAVALMVILVLAALVGAPLAAYLTGHPPNTQYPLALSNDGQPIGIMQHTYFANGVDHNPHGSLFILGSDALGRDELVRVLYGARISLLVACAATGLALVIGITLGLLAGYLGGRTDAVVNRLTETAMAFPYLLLAVAIAVVVGPGLLNIVIIIAVFTWYYPARIVRSVTVATKRLTFVTAARSIGTRSRRILWVHLLPQVWPPLLVYATSIIGYNILFAAGLAYLGVGVPPPTATWGQMLSTAVTSGMYQVDIALALVPGLAILLTMLAFNLLGDSIRDALDPKAGRR
jgi:peptide/nickel transport system permease protein